MKQIKINAYAKINLCIDVLGKLPSGYHQVEMVMQQVDLFDTVTVGWGVPSEGRGPAPLMPERCGQADCGETDSGSVLLTVSRADLPVNENNIAYKAALLMKEQFLNLGADLDGTGCPVISVDLKKRIPVAAGLAGGSADGAAVIHGLNRLWELNLSLSQLMELGSKLGSDVPFCVMGQAALNPELGFAVQTAAELGAPVSAATEFAPTTCALATGTGTELKSVLPLRGWVVLCKPDIGVSTAEVYGGLQLSEQTEHPDAKALVTGICEGNQLKVKQNMKNLLEEVTLVQYPQVAQIKKEMEQLCKPYHTLMSGSGPTVFGLFFNQKKAKAAYETMRKLHSETYLARLL